MSEQCSCGKEKPKSIAPFERSISVLLRDKRGGVTDFSSIEKIFRLWFLVPSLPKERACRSRVRRGLQPVPRF